MGENEYFCTMTAPEYLQLKAFARMDGALLALLWTASFACYVMGFKSSGLSMVGMILALITPFFVAKRLKKFRDTGLDGQISFRRAWAYALFTFLDASLLFAAVHFVYFSYMDHGYFVSMLTKTMTAPENAQALGGGMMAAVNQSLNAIAGMRPIDLALNIMMSNMLMGLLMSFPVAIAMKRSVK